MTAPDAGSGNSTRKWSTRPGWVRPSRSAPPRGRWSESHATRCWSPPRPGGSGNCPSGSVRICPAPRNWVIASGSCCAGSPRTPTASISPGSTRTPGGSWWPSSRSSARPPGWYRTSGPSWWKGSATSWVTGGSWCTARWDGRCWRPGAWRWPPTWSGVPGSIPSPWPLTTVSSCGFPTGNCPPWSWTWCGSPRRRWSVSSRTRWAAPRCSRPGSGSAHPAPCCCLAATAAGCRCGSSVTGPPSCSRWHASTRTSPSPWRRCGNA